MIKGLAITPPIIGRERFIQRSHLVGIQIVEHDTNHLGVGITLGDMPHAVSEIDLGATLHYQDLAPSPLRLADHHQITDAISAVFSVLACRHARSGRDEFAHFTNQLLRAFVITDNGMRRIIRRFIQLENVLHGRDKVSADLRDTPFLYLPWFQSVFLRADGSFRS